MSRTNIVRSGDELVDDATTLFFEVEGLVATACQLRLPRESIERWQYNAIVESFAVHARSLTLFFFGHLPSKFQTRSGDIIAEDFFIPTGHWASVCPAIPPLVDASKLQADKQIAHMTLERRGIYDKNTGMKTWQAGLLVQEIARVGVVFLDARPQLPDHVAAATRAQFDNALSSLDSMTTASVSPIAMMGMNLHMTGK